MTIRPIRSEATYDEALGEIDRLMGAAPGTPESDRLEVLVTLVERYESEHWAIEAPDPVSAPAPRSTPNRSPDGRASSSRKSRSHPESTGRSGRRETGSASSCRTPARRPGTGASPSRTSSGTIMWTATWTPCSRAPPAWLSRRAGSIRAGGIPDLAHDGHPLRRADRAGSCVSMRDSSATSATRG